MRRVDFHAVSSNGGYAVFAASGEPYGHVRVAIAETADTKFKERQPLPTGVYRYRRMVKLTLSSGFDADIPVVERVKGSRLEP